MVEEGYHSLPGNHQATRYDLLSKISKLQNVDVNEFLHFVINLVSGLPVPADSVFRAPQVQPLVEAYKLFFSQVVNLNLSKEQIVDDLKKANVNEGVISMCVESITARWAETRKILSNKVASISSSQLLDFDWKLHLISSSDKISTVQEPVLLLNLTVENSGKKEDVLVELSKEDLDSLLSSFSNVNEAIQQLKV